MNQFYNYKDSKLGTFGFIVEENEKLTKIIKIYLPKDKSILISQIQSEYPFAKKSKSFDNFALNLYRFIQGEDIKFDLSFLDFNVCTNFQKKVLIADYNIPRGFVSTYSRISKFIGIPKGARAVGNALANNPFPIVIPCHRTIKSDGTLGSFQGGIQMKRTLLEQEGVITTENRHLLNPKIFY
ncbi:MAG: MGMT family protein [Candidatus Methanofastidiosa archaeon]|nr:MGMT family protein [Candidatus Methanofastidiosa archaeon]